MAQTRYHNYNRPVASFAENARFVGILETGRYRGFDTLVTTASLVFKLQHTSVDGKKHVDESEALGNYSGIFITPQGVVIKEDGEITGLTVDTNAANAHERLDVVVATHVWDATAGGTAATYSIIKGALGGPVEPALTNPETQTKIGVVRIPASAGTLASAVWEPADSPGLAGRDYARRDLENLFEDTLSINYDSAGHSAISPDGSDILTLAEGNTFYVTGSDDINQITAKENGTVIKLVFGDTLTVNHNTGYIDLGPAHADGIGKSFAEGTVAEFLQVAVGADTAYGHWKLTGCMGLDNQYLSTSSLYLNAKESTSDPLIISVIGDTGSSHATVLVDNKADSTSWPRTVSLPKRTGRIPVYASSGQDVWNSNSHDAGDYEAISGSWAVESGDLLSYKYILLDKTLIIQVYITNSVTSGTAGNTLKVYLPDGLEALGNHFGSGQVREGSTYTGVTVRAFDTYDYLQICKLDNTNFLVGTLNHLYFEITLQVS